MSAFTRAQAANYAEGGIRVNCLVVGMVETPLITVNSDEAVLARKNVVDNKRQSRRLGDCLEVVQ